MVGGTAAALHCTIYKAHKEGYQAHKESYQAQKKGYQAHKKGADWFTMRRPFVAERLWPSD